MMVSQMFSDGKKSGLQVGQFSSQSLLLQSHAGKLLNNARIQNFDSSDPRTVWPGKDSNDSGSCSHMAYFLCMTKL